MSLDLRQKRILITGGNGFLGSWVVKNLLDRGVPKHNIRTPSSQEFDLRIQENCKKAVVGCEVVFHLAARVGGIGYNREKPAELFLDNLLMGVQLMEEARKSGVEKFVAIGTVCSYPKFTPVPFKEDDLWNGYPEETNAPYGLAKKMLLVQAQSYRKQYGFNAIYLIPVNLYGPGDNFDDRSSHVIPALIKKIITAKENNDPFIEAWGTGLATREFLFAGDAAEAIVKAAMEYQGDDPVNIGSGEEIAIRDLASLIASTAGYTGEIQWDHAKPDGQPRRKLDTTRAEKFFGFKAKKLLRDGLPETIDWYLRNRS